METELFVRPGQPSLPTLQSSAPPMRNRATGLDRRSSTAIVWYWSDSLRWREWRNCFAFACSLVGPLCAPYFISATPGEPLPRRLRFRNRVFYFAALRIVRSEMRRTGARLVVDSDISRRRLGKEIEMCTDLPRPIPAVDLNKGTLRIDAICIHNARTNTIGPCSFAEINRASAPTPQKPTAMPATEMQKTFDDLIAVDDEPALVHSEDAASDTCTACKDCGACERASAASDIGKLLAIYTAGARSRRALKQASVSSSISLPPPIRFIRASQRPRLPNL